MRRHPENTSAAQVFARDETLPAHAPLFYLPDGQADACRDRARSGELICPIPGCEDPRLQTVGGDRGRRHHFRHRPGTTGHPNETIIHHTSKHLLARWARPLLPDGSTITVDVEMVGSRRADVLITLPDGQRVAYEVQCSGLEYQEFVARRADFAAAGVTDQWFFGFPGAHYRPARAFGDPDGLVTLSDAGRKSSSWTGIRSCGAIPSLSRSEQASERSP